MKSNFKEFRENLGLTQEEMSKSINYSIAYIKKIEAGERKGSLSFWSKIQAVYNLNNAQIWRLAQNDK